ncbi:oxalate:formate antiporter, partial [Bacillus sp. JJ664]
MAGIDSVKEIIYIYGDKHNHCFITSGINYKEFVQGLPFPLQNMLLLKHDVQWSDYNLNSSFFYVEKDYINQFILDQTENDELCWIDFEELADLDELEPKEIAELLYLAHKKEPLNKPFIPRL